MIDLANAFAPASWEHWLGTDPYGSDLALRIAEGAWLSLSTAALVTALTLSAGLAVGSLSALAPPSAEAAVKRLIDGFLAFPGFLLAILLASIMPPSNATVVFALSVTGWAGHARLSNALVHKALAAPYIEAARAAGAPMPRILLRHVWPQLRGQLAIQALLSMAHVILGEASLSFLGLGGPADSPSLGRLIAEGRRYLVEAPQLSVAPGIALVATLAFFHFLVLRERRGIPKGVELG